MSRADNEEDKFLLACRLFQKGLANMERFRERFPNSELLLSKDEKEEKLIDVKLHFAQSSSRYQKHLPKGIELKLKKITEDRDLVDSIKKDFFRAIECLNVREIGRYGEDKTEMLDFAILIALHWKELSLIAKHAGTEDIANLTAKRQTSIEDISSPLVEDDWRDYDPDFEDSVKMRKYIKRLEEMKEIHEDSDSAWYTEKFADENRKGLPLIPYGHLKQYKLYLDGYELHLTMDRKNRKRAL